MTEDRAARRGSQRSLTWWVAGTASRRIATLYRNGRYLIPFIHGDHTVVLADDGVLSRDGVRAMLRNDADEPAGAVGKDGRVVEIRVVLA